MILPNLIPSFYSIMIPWFSVHSLPLKISQVSLMGNCPTGDRSKWPELPLSQEKLTVPSLWFIHREMGGKLVNWWFLEPARNWVVLIFNRQIWDSLEYLEKYQIVHRYASFVRKEGYNLRICNNRGDTLAIYYCNFSSTSGNQEEDVLKCQMKIDDLPESPQKSPKQF